MTVNAAAALTARPFDLELDLTPLPKSYCFKALLTFSHLKCGGARLVAPPKKRVHGLLALLRVVHTETT
jgi:hypothetical protein